MPKLLTLIFLLLSFYSFSQEICDNGIDDDADGLIDLKDTTDCSCNLTYDTSAANIIPNPSFEQRTCCPSASSQMNCVNNWVQASGNTSDYYNTCGLRFIGGFSPPPLPLPNGNGYVGFHNIANVILFPQYQEYVGTCLLDTFRIGHNYQLQFYTAHGLGSLTTPIGLFATTNCANLPFPLAIGINCPTASSASWVLLDSAVVTHTTTAWTLVTLNFTPTQNYTAIVIGPTCSQLNGENYYYLDHLTLTDSSNLNFQRVEIIDSGNFCLGNLKLKADFDSVPLSFQWYKDSIAIVGATDSNFSVSSGGTGAYQVRLLFDSGCVISSVYHVDSTIISLNIDSLGSCPVGSPAGRMIFTNIQGGVPPYMFSLNSSPFVLDTFFNQLFPGNYQVIVRDSNLCESSQNLTIEAFPMPTASFSADSVCFGETTSFIDNSTIARGTINQWGWNTPGNPITQNTSYTYGSDGVYAVTHVVISDSGCIDDTTINVVVNPLPIADFSFSPTQVYTFATDVCFTNLTTGATNYLWDFDFSGPTGASTATSPCTVQFPSNQEETYRVKLVAISDRGCVDSTFVNVIILDEFILYAPNSFSPNEDGKNDFFNIVTAGIETFEILIFNRWGEVIFSGSQQTNSWDGKHNGINVPTGAYIYKIKLKAKNKEIREVIGHVNLLR